MIRKQIVAYIFYDFPWPNNSESFICPEGLRDLKQEMEKKSHPSNNMEENSAGYECVARIKYLGFIPQLHSLVVWPWVRH